MKRKEPRISVRIDQDLKDRLAAVVKATRLDEPTIIRCCVEAFCKYVADHQKSPQFPIEIEKVILGSGKLVLELPHPTKRRSTRPKDSQ